MQALNTPREFGSAIRDFERYLFALQKVLPCSECRKEFGLILDELPPRPFFIKGRVGVVAYIYTVHCAISDRLNNVNCHVKFLESERKLLKENTKPFGCVIDEVMEELHNDAHDRDIYRQIQDAKIKLRRMYENEDADS